MPLGGLQDEADLQRWLQDQLSQPGAVPQEAMIGLAGRLGRSGVATATFGGAVNFATLNIPHGLASAPTSVQITPQQASDGSAIVANLTAPPDATNIPVVVQTNGGSTPANGVTTDLYWTAGV